MHTTYELQQGFLSQRDGEYVYTGGEHFPSRKYLVIPQLPQEAVERFFSRVEKGDGCWAWLGAKDAYGRGFFAWRGQKFRAPRASWAIAHGRSPDMDVCHSCDNPNCVNPDHLWLGTHTENMADMLAKGRRNTPHLTHCKHGHEMNAGNIYIRPDNGKRQCRTCGRDRLRRRRRAA